MPERQIIQALNSVLWCDVHEASLDLFHPDTTEEQVLDFRQDHWDCLGARL